MKKALCSAIATLMIFVMCACGSTEKAAVESTSVETTAQTTVAAVTEPETIQKEYAEYLLADLFMEYGNNPVRVEKKVKDADVAITGNLNKIEANGKKIQLTTSVDSDQELECTIGKSALLEKALGFKEGDLVTVKGTVTEVDSDAFKMILDDIVKTDPDSLTEGKEYTPYKVSETQDLGLSETGTNISSVGIISSIDSDGKVNIVENTGDILGLYCTPLCGELLDKLIELNVGDVVEVKGIFDGAFLQGMMILEDIQPADSEEYANSLAESAPLEMKSVDFYGFVNHSLDDIVAEIPQLKKYLDTMVKSEGDVTFTRLKAEATVDGLDGKLVFFFDENNTCQLIIFLYDLGDSSALYKKELFEGLHRDYCSAFGDPILSSGNSDYLSLIMANKDIDEEWAKDDCQTGFAYFYDTGTFQSFCGNMNALQTLDNAIWPTTE